MQQATFLNTQVKCYPYPRSDKVRERRVRARHSTCQFRWLPAVPHRSNL